MKDEPPLFLIAVLIAILILLLLLVINSTKTPQEGSQGDITLSECFIEAPRIPYYPKIYTLGNKMDDIIFCESSNNPEAYNPTSGASGLFQIIPSSERFCEEGLGRELDMFNKEDNLICADYLYRHGGLAHWRASADCHGHYE